jgi:F-type H+-transporting ATPase subunit a
MAALAVGGWLATRALSVTPTPRQTVLEMIIIAIEDQIQATIRAAPKPYVAMIGTLFLFILAANWSSLVPGVEPPTAHIETDAALGLIVFFAILYFGIRRRGLGGYLKTFAEPTFFMIPLNIVETFTRTFSLIVRLFGNVMSGVFIVGIVLSLARPARAHSAHGARSAHRRGAGLHFHGAGHGVHRRALDEGRSGEREKP